MNSDQQNLPAVRVPTMLRGIYIRRLKFEITSHEFSPLDAGQKLNVQIAIHGQLIADMKAEDTGESGLAYFTRFGFRYRAIPLDREVAEDSDPIIAEADAEIASEWLGVPEGFSPRERELFGAQSVVRICWPYWRELAHSSMSRMSMPIIVIPPMGQVTLPTQTGSEPTPGPVAP